MPRRYYQLLLLALSALVFGHAVRAEIPTRDQIDKAADLQLPTDPAAVIAVVGQSPILFGELSPKVESRIAEVLAKSGQKVPEDQLFYARVNLTRGALAQAIQNKMMRELFLLDQVATQSAEKRRDADTMMQNKARQMFFDSEVPELKKQYNVEELTELDRLLREKASSLQARQREFVDAMLGHLYIRSKVEKDPNVTIAEINEYYETHKDDYLHKARARWEQLTALFSKFPSREAASQAIIEMGREAYFGGNMQAVAKLKSQEPFASKGGLHDWTEQGSLASSTLDDQIFSIPTNKMSDIIEDADGLHIIRVLERDEAGITTLANVQDEIRAKLRQDKITKSQEALMESMRDRVAVWSLFPEDIPGAKPMPTKAATNSTFNNTTTTLR